MKINNVFYVNLLWKILTDLLINQVNEPLSQIIINNKEKWKIKEILDVKSY